MAISSSDTKRTISTKRHQTSKGIKLTSSFTKKISQHTLVTKIFTLKPAGPSSSEISASTTRKKGSTAKSSPYMTTRNFTYPPFFTSTPLKTISSSSSTVTKRQSVSSKQFISSSKKFKSTIKTNTRNFTYPTVVSHSSLTSKSYSSQSPRSTDRTQNPTFKPSYMTTRNFTYPPLSMSTLPKTDVFSSATPFKTTKNPCGQNFFQCQSGKTQTFQKACISTNERCDGKTNCPDNSDEQNCSVCQEGFIK